MTTYTQETIARILSAGDVIMTVTDAEYPNGEQGACYALCSRQGTASAISIREAQQLQSAGVQYADPHPVYVADFATFFGPDFNPIGGTPIPLGKPAPSRLGPTCEPYVRPGTLEEA